MICAHTKERQAVIARYPYHYILYTIWYIEYVYVGGSIAREAMEPRRRTEGLTPPLCADPRRIS